MTEDPTSWKALREIAEKNIADRKGRPWTDEWMAYERYGTCGLLDRFLNDDDKAKDHAAGKTGFVVLMFPLNGEGAIHQVSNVDDPGKYVELPQQRAGTKVETLAKAHRKTDD